MNKKVLGITILFGAILFLITGYFYMESKQRNPQDTREEQIVAINEITQLIEMGQNELAMEKSDALQQQIRETIIQGQSTKEIFFISGICFVFLGMVMVYVYIAILRPFDKMEDFAEKIAQGNFDVALEYERSNYFGKFTWAFDSMRREITKARSCEKEAIENNKTVIATLSHDIKTPIASIRAYAEGLQANMDSSVERRERYLRVLIRKCDEVAKLTNDLFLHSLSDLDKLKINLETFEIVEYMQEIIEEMDGDKKDIRFTKPDFSIQVQADRNRLEQILENLINNGRKYAKTQIDVSLEQTEHCVEIHVRDYGEGIPDGDMPFIFDKFYRGKNCGKEQGSGLGLYIVKYITEQMGGSVEVRNCGKGLEVIVRVVMDTGVSDRA